MKKILLFVSASFLFSYLSCLPEDDNSFKYPKVYTNPINDITSDGARFNGRVESENMEKITEFGFLWGEDPKLATKTFILQKDSSTSDLFYTDVRSSLVDQKVYYVRSFVKQSGKTIYGNILSFKSLGSEGPKITSLSPETAAFGDTVNVIGKNFTTNAILKYGSADISFSILKAGKDKLTFILPDSLPISPAENIVSISTEGNVSKSPVPLKLDLDRILPKITSITPSTVKACDTVTLRGTNLAIKGHETQVKVYVSGDELSILKATEQSIICVLKKIPKSNIYFNIDNGLYSVYSQAPGLIAQRPEIISVSPLVYKPKDVITIKGKNFPYCDNSMTAFVNGSFIPLKILSISKGEIKLQLPTECLGSFNIMLTINSGYESQAFETPPLSPQPPEITSIEPSHGSLGDLITIKGTRLKGASIDILDTLSTTETEIKGRLNEFAMLKENGFVDVQIFGCGSVVKENGFKYDPIEILDFNPKTITSPSQQITITGRNFSSGSRQNIITIGTYTTHISSDDNQTLTLPAKALIPDAWRSVNESFFIVVENGMARQATSSTPLAINYAASWFPLNDIQFPGIYLGINFSIGNYGYAASNGSSPLMRYDPSTDTWEEKATFPGHATGYRVSASANGKGYTGLDLNYNREWWEYDPITNSWNRKADYPGSFAGGAIGFEIGGKIYVGGGSGTSWNHEFWEYDPVTDSWAIRMDIPINAGRQTPNFSFKGKGYVYGKSDNGQSVELTYYPNSNVWSTRVIQSFEDGTNFSCMVFQDYVVFGGEPINYYSPGNVFYKVIPGTGNLINATYIGGLRKGQTGFAIGNYGYWGMGIDPPEYIHFREMWRFDPSLF